MSRTNDGLWLVDGLPPVAQNANGLTFDRWLAAACFGVPPGRARPNLWKLREAWKAGEDPTEWARELNGSGLSSR